RFRVWAPLTRTVEVVVEVVPAGGGRQLPVVVSPAVFALHKSPDGTFGGQFSQVHVGDRYRYRVDGKGPFPDPASRFQPGGVPGPSEVVDASAFSWSDAGWAGRTLEELVIYELHVGTFTPEGTFAAARARLPYLKDLGVTAVELMPVADFPGQRNWGYDGVDLFAPSRCYGRPDNLRRLVDSAHRLGLAVPPGAGYNPPGPDGNYLGVCRTFYFFQRAQTGPGR